MFTMIEDYRRVIFGIGIVVGGLTTIGGAYLMWKTDKEQVFFLGAATLMVTGLYLLVSSIDIYTKHTDMWRIKYPLSPKDHHADGKEVL